MCAVQVCGSSAVQVCGTSKVYYTSNLTGPKAHNIIYFNRNDAREQRMQHHLEQPLKGAWNVPGIASEGRLDWGLNSATGAPENDVF